MTAVVYLLLRRKPDIVDNLFAATFLDIGGKRGKFRTATKGNHSIDVSSLARRYMKKNPAHREFAVDFYLARALGYLLKKTALSRYNSEKADFTKLWDTHQPQDYRGLTRAGGLALRTRNVAFILHDIVGAQNVRITKNTGALPAGAPARAAPVKVGGQDMVEDTFGTDQELYNQFVNRGPYMNHREKFALAAVYPDIVPQRGRATHEPNPQHPWQLQNAVQIPGRPIGTRLDDVRVLPTRVTAASGGRGALPFSHWVVIEGFNRTANETQLLIWSWGKNFRIDFQNNRILSYIRDVIFGELQ